MKLLRRIIFFLFLGCAAVLAHYYLPQRDIVKVVDTDVKRMDISKGSPFWDRPDIGTHDNSSRDVRFISTVAENGKTRVYRNEDTGWGFPFYFKFDSSDLSAKAQDMANQGDVWVAVSHYGWRIRMFSIWPNAYKVKRVSGPDAVLIPWFNIFFILLVAFIAFSIWRMMRRWKKKNVDPIAEKIGDELDEVGDAVKSQAGKVGKELDETRSGIRKFMRRWFGSSGE